MIKRDLAESGDLAGTQQRALNPRIEAVNGKFHKLAGPAERRIEELQEAAEA
jgi:hypothetical protein